jgi:hypothetical protein
MESFGICVKVINDPSYADIDGFVLVPGGKAIIATWLRRDEVWHGDVARKAPQVREFGEVAGYASTHSGTPQHSSGALTIVALAQEAAVPRNALTQRHLDLKNEFYDKVRARGQIPESEARLGMQIAKLRKLRVRDTGELAQLREDVLHLVRVVNQLTTENQQLRAELAAPSARVRVLPTPPQPVSPLDTRGSP